MLAALCNRRFVALHSKCRNRRTDLSVLMTMARHYCARRVALFAGAPSDQPLDAIEALLLRAASAAESASARAWTTARLRREAACWSR